MMSDFLIYAILLALVLISNILSLSIGIGRVMNPYSIWLNIKAALFIGVVNLLMALFAFNIGIIISGFIIDFTEYVGHLITAFVGLKLILETNKNEMEKRELLIEDSLTLFGLSFASSFNTFLVFLGFGLIWTKWVFWTPFLLVAILIFISVIFGTIIGNKYKAGNFGLRVKFIGGVFLILLSSFLIFQ